MSALFIAYTVAVIAAARPISGHLAYSFLKNWDTYYRRRPDEPTALMWSSAIALAVVVAIAWPLVMVWAVAGRLAPAVGAEREVLLARREADLAEQKGRLARAEREAGLEPWEMGN